MDEYRRWCRNYLGNRKRSLPFHEAHDFSDSRFCPLRRKPCSSKGAMESLASLTIFVYVLAFLIVFGGLVAWWVRRPGKNRTPGEPPTRYVDDSEDRIA